MTTDAVRSLIREVLAEELARLRPQRSSSATSSSQGSGSSRKEEIVSVTTQDELQAFVQRILKLSRTTSMRDKIARGDYIFRLANQQKPSSDGTENSATSLPAATAGGVVRIDNGFLSERRVENLPPETRVVQLGAGVRFTPLARDRLRQRKIAVERMK